MIELKWEGKYDKDGKRVAPLKVALPFQTVETVNESAQQRQRRMASAFGWGMPVVQASKAHSTAASACR